MLTSINELISSNTLFHFTNTRENLINILTNEFRPRYCLEDFNILDPSLPHDPELEIAIPMICFCDLPLSRTKNHLSIYGNYGIGLTKEWGMRNGITPVLYAHPQSILISLIQSLRNIISKQADQDSLDNLYSLACLLKPYEGKFWRKDRYIPNVRFYDEREWRYIPSFRNGRYGLSKEAFLDDKIRLVANKHLGSDNVISFEPKDIRYIVVAHEDEVLSMYDDVWRIKKKYTEDERKLLVSRIISAAQIQQDF